MRPRRLVLLGLLAAAATATVVFWSWIDAQGRAVVVLSSTSPTPVLSWAVRVVTDEPRVEEIVVAGLPTTLVRPGHGKRWHAVVLLAGLADGGRSNGDVQRLANGLARAGYLVLVPDLPGIADGEIVQATVRSAVNLALEAASRDDVRGGQVSLVGAWAGAAVGLLAAEDPLLAPRVSVVAGVAPWTAAPNLIRLATTGFSLEDGDLKAYQTAPQLSLEVGRSLVAALAPSAARTQLLALLHGVDTHDPDPLRVIRGLAVGNLPADAAAVVNLLANRDPAGFENLYAALPNDLHAKLERLSPLVGAAQLQARVELATARHDHFVPPSESRALERASPHVHVTLTGAVTNGLPHPSFGDAFAVNRFVVRALRAAD
jgi:pimeloyl-ACP methyl ester carboxylesterase